MSQTHESWCSKCRKRTTWRLGRKHQICEGCRGTFPCGHNCTHADCREARGELVEDARGVLRETSELAKVSS